MSCRDEFVQACTVSDLDCLDQNRFRLFQPLNETALSSAAVWPNERHSCDFCDTFASVMSHCSACRRWLGLSDCKCCERAHRRTSSEPPGGRFFNVVESDARCRWCAEFDSGAPPRSCGHSMGLLRRVVFVLEPVACDRWVFGVSQRLLVALLEGAAAGTVLLYSIECAGNDASWVRAMERVRQFAAEPRRFLPDECRLDDAYGGGAPMPRVSVLLATHSTNRREQEPVRLEQSAERSRTFAWWSKCIDERLLTNAHPLPANAGAIDELYIQTCSLFPDGAIGAANDRILRALADKHQINVSAVDGDCSTTMQVRGRKWEETT